MPMDSITIAMRHVKHNIPKTILDVAFQPGVKRKTLDSCIMEEVIIDKVSIDCSIVAGKTTKIVLLSNWLEFTDAPPSNLYGMYQGSSVYRIPPEYREHKEIIAVNKVSYPSAMYGNNLSGNLSGCYGTTISGLVQSALNNQTGACINVNPNAELLDGNLIRIYPYQVVHVDWMCECRLFYDNDFNNLEISSYHPFADLVVSAVKMYIYNTLIVDIDRAYITGGSELGTVKDIVLSYADEHSNYKDLLLKFRGSGTYDSLRMNNLLKYMIP